MTKPPKHVAIIMDGNGRWAEARNKNRLWGHTRGSEVAQDIVEHCSNNTEVEHLTLYAFSTENWSRPQEEVSFLFKLLDRHLRKKSDYLCRNNVKLKVIGRLEQLPEDLQVSIQKIVDKTQSNTGLNLTLALNYGGKQDLVDKVNFHFKNAGNTLDEKTLDSLMTDSGNMPNPDLIIRTSGEQRLSNFMLWQSAYSELYFTQTHWPDFTAHDFDKALLSFNTRDRRFGTVTYKKTNLHKDAQV